MTLIIIGAGIAWAFSQVTKVVISLARAGTWGGVPWRLVWAGGMPSSHAAFVTAAAVLVAEQEGIRSPLFGVAFVFATIVIYDRAKVYHIYDTFRREFPALAERVQLDPRLEDLVGHTPVQLLVGVVVGIGAAIVYWKLQS